MLLFERNFLSSQKYVELEKSKNAYGKHLAKIYVKLKKISCNFLLSEKLTELKFGQLILMVWNKEFLEKRQQTEISSNARFWQTEILAENCLVAAL